MYGASFWYICLIFDRRLNIQTLERRVPTNLCPLALIVDLAIRSLCDRLQLLLRESGRLRSVYLGFLAHSLAAKLFLSDLLDR